MFIVSGVVVLIGSAILWWDLMNEGVTTSGALSAALFTVLGLFWLALGLHARDSTDPPDDEADG